MTLNTRLWGKVDQRSLDECWPWTGGKAHGHGYIWDSGNVRPVQRVIADMAGIEGEEIHHVCENRACCNPLHLEGLSRREHMERHGRVKLTDGQANEVRHRARAGENQRDLAREFGVSRELVSAIKRGVRR